MNSPEAPRSDPERLEDGLARLRELGYLQTPAEAYVAERVGRAGGSRRRSAVAAGLWIGGAGGFLVALLLTLSAIAAEPGLLDRPRSLIWLALDITIVLVLLGALGTGTTAWGLLRPADGGVRLASRWFERPLVWLPGLVAALYLTDRLGRAVLVDLAGSSWAIGALGVALGVGLLGAGVSWSLSGALALARLQGRGVFRPARLAAWERPLPLVVFAAGAFVLLGLGPYRGLEPLPRLSEIDVRAVQGADVHRMLLVAVDGVQGPTVWPDDAPSLRPVSNSALGSALHPAAYWNELATGFPVHEHGLGSASAFGLRGFDGGLGGFEEDPLLDLLLRQLLPGVGLGRTVAADRRDLRRPPFWEIAAMAGRRVRVVNWWATYPAIAIPGLEIVTDRHFLRLHEGRAEGPGLVWPPALVVEDVTQWREEFGAARERLKGYAQGTERLHGHGLPGSVRDAWDLATLGDLYHVARAIEAAKAAPAPDLLVVHLNGSDIVGRALERIPDVDAEVARGLRVAQEAYVHDLIERLLGAWSEEVAAVLRGSEGVWVAGSSSVPEAPVHWAPWVLWSLGVPPSADMAMPSVVRGAPLPDDLPATYGRTDPPDHPDGRSGDDLEQLRSLGYIES